MNRLNLVDSVICNVKRAGAYFPAPGGPPSPSPHPAGDRPASDRQARISAVLEPGWTPLSGRSGA
jgi:hypothetical protein